MNEDLKVFDSIFGKLNQARKDYKLIAEKESCHIVEGKLEGLRKLKDVFEEFGFNVTLKGE